jgi:small subunit ribosomal protein S4
VNGVRSYSPNHLIKSNDLIAVREKSKNHPQIKEAIEGAPEAPNYLAISKDKLEAKLVNLPLRDQIPVKLNEQLVVEYYSK